MPHLAIVQIGNNIAGHINKDDAFQAKIHQVFLKDFFDTIQLFLIEYVGQ